MGIITLTTDFGDSDPFVGVMKGVILGITSNVTLVDLTHEIPPQDLLAAALALESSVEYFPNGTVHLAVVDPGVGSDRAAVAVDCGQFKLVGPDNGIFTLVLSRFPAHSRVALTNDAFHRHPVSATFHGRDLFAPAAAHIAGGTPIEELGERIEVLNTLTIPEPALLGPVMEIHILQIDRFGNLVTDLTKDLFEAWAAGVERRLLKFRVCDRNFFGLSHTYADVRSGDPLAYFGSGGRLEIGIREGNAAERFHTDRKPSLSIILPTTSGR